MQQPSSRTNTMAVYNSRFWLQKQPFKMHGHLVTRSSRHTVNSSQLRYTRRSTRHTILGDFRVWRVDRVTSWLAPSILQYNRHDNRYGLPVLHTQLWSRMHAVLTENQIEHLRWFSKFMGQYPAHLQNTHTPWSLPRLSTDEGCSCSVIR